MKELTWLGEEVPGTRAPTLYLNPSFSNSSSEVFETFNDFCWSNNIVTDCTQLVINKVYKYYYHYYRYYFLLLFYVFYPLRTYL